MKKILAVVLLTLFVSSSTFAETHIFSPSQEDRLVPGDTIIIVAANEDWGDNQYFVIALADSSGQVTPVLVEPTAATQRQVRLVEWTVPAGGGTLIAAVWDVIEQRIVSIHSVALSIASSPSPIYGDVNNDGYVNERDVEILDEFSAFPYVNERKATRTPSQSRKADVNLDGKIDQRDTDLVTFFLLGDLPGLPLGDVNGDGKVSTLDIVLVRRHMSRIQPLKNPKMGDVNGDGIVGAADILQIRRHILGQTWPTQ